VQECAAPHKVRKVLGSELEVRTNLSAKWCGIHCGCTTKPLTPGANTPGPQDAGEKLSARWRPAEGGIADCLTFYLTEPTAVN
jgi:hypothetical protein